MTIVQEDDMKRLTVSDAQMNDANCRRADLPDARRSRADAAAAEVDAQESFVQELLATFGDRWEW